MVGEFGGSGVGRWRRFWWRAMRKAVRWGTSVLEKGLTIVAVLGLVGVVVAIHPWNGKHHPLLVPLLIGAVVVSLMLCHGAYLTWRDDDDQRQHLRGAPVSPNHYRELQSLLGSVRTSAANRLSLPDDDDRRVLLDHFPELQAPLSGWNESVALLKDISGALEHKGMKVAEDWGLRALPYDANLVPLLLNYLRSALDNPEAGYPAFPIIWFGGSGAEPNVWGPSGILVHFDTPQSEPELRRVLEIPTAYWEDALKWPESERYASRTELSGWKDTQAMLLEPVCSLLKRDFYRKGDGCERCA